jgi:hypothetical protein
MIPASYPLKHVANTMPYSMSAAKRSLRGMSFSMSPHVEDFETNITKSEPDSTLIQPKTIIFIAIVKYLLQ